MSSIYVNTEDSYNRIYPYIDVVRQYPAKMDIPKYSFYYEADASHNPGRGAVWTDAYVDPAGHGWMVSSIAPVWRRGRLEAVVGIDVTLKTLIGRLLAINLPWGGYALVVDRKGSIIAMPPQAGRDLGLRELTSHDYAQAIRSDNFKPDTYNFLRRPDTRALGEAILAHDHGQIRVRFAGGDGGYHLASFARIDGPGWALVVFAPEARIFAEANQLRETLNIAGLAMIGLLVVFYLLFFAYLNRRARAMSKRIAIPIRRLAVLLARIGAGEHRQTFAGSPIRELDELGQRLVDTGNQLADAHELIVRHEYRLSEALAQQRRMNNEQVDLIRRMSHELRTPMAIVDSGAQIIERRAATLPPDQIRERAGRLRSAVGRMAAIFDELVWSLDERAGTPEALAQQGDALDALVTRITRQVISPERIHLSFDGTNPVVAHGPIIAVVLDTVLDNALRYSPADKRVSVTTFVAQDQAVIVVAHEGEGILAAERDNVDQRFFRDRDAGASDGVGVGLLMARKLIRSIGGEMQIECPVHGMIVTIRFPLHGDGQQLPTREDPEA